MRRMPLLVMVFLCALLALPAVAQDAPNIVSFNGFSFSYPSSLGAYLDVAQTPATGADVPAGPLPALTRFTLWQQPAEEERTGPVATLVLISADALAVAGPSAAEAAKLDALLAAQPDLATVAAEALPALPLPNGPLALQARASYLEFGAVRGVAYLTSVKFDASPVLATQLLYVFVGRHQDNGAVVALVAPVTTTLLPAELAADFDMNAFNADVVGNFAATAATLAAASDADFSPSLSALTSIARSVNISSILPGVQPPAGNTPPTPATPPTAAPTPVVNTDPTLRGLAGTWSLVSFGPPDASLLPTSGVPVSLSFGNEGVFGNDGCNSFTGFFSYDNNSLEITGLASTLMACPPPVMEVADAFRAALTSVTGFSASADTLTLTYDGGALAFTKSGG